jgi:hypothetical protein
MNLFATPGCLPPQQVRNRFMPDLSSRRVTSPAASDRAMHSDLHFMAYVFFPGLVTPRERCSGLAALAAGVAARGRRDRRNWIMFDAAHDRFYDRGILRRIS